MGLRQSKTQEGKMAKGAFLIPVERIERSIFTDSRAESDSG
jgi:hypothetical protein